jgi:predicted nucleic acid-binding Zn ribbon protein
MMTSVSDILDILQARGHWQTPPLQILLKCWHEVVGSNIALQTRPVSIYRDVLRVATSSAAWAQTLTFERKNLLSKVNQKLSVPLTDIHFSTAGWNISSSRPKPQKPSYTEHPFYIEQITASEPVDTNTRLSVNATFDSWVKRMQASSHNLPLCPQCSCPTPVGEIQRWGICALCAAKRF